MCIHEYVVYTERERGCMGYIMSILRILNYKDYTM